MTSKTNAPSYGIPAPITQLTYEQDLKMRLIEDGLRANFHDNKEDIITYVVALQHQNFLLANSVTNLVKKWPKPPKVQPTTNEDLSMFGILLETKN